MVVGDNGGEVITSHCLLSKSCGLPDEVVSNSSAGENEVR